MSTRELKTTSLSALGVALTILGAARCGGGSSATPASSFDAGASTDSAASPDDASDSSSAIDAPSGDSASFDAASYALYIGARFNIEGATTDDYVVFDDTATGIVRAMPIAGGAATMIATYDVNGNHSVKVDGFVAVVSDGPSITVWSSSVAPRTIPAATFFGATSDGQYIGYVANLTVTDAGTVGDAVLAKTDGSSVVTLEAGVVASSSGCSPGFFVTPSLYVGAFLCSDAEASSGAQDLYAYAIPSGTKSELAPNVSLFDVSLDATGKNIAVNRSDGVASVVTYGVGSVPIESNVADARMTPDGANVVYETTGGALKIASATTGIPKTLIAAGVTGIADPSRDSKWMLGSVAPADAGDDAGSTDVTALISLIDGASEALGQLSPGPFTTDVSYAIVLNPPSAFSAAPVDGGALIPITNQTAITSQTSSYLFPGAGARVVIESEAIAADGGVSGYFDLSVIDLAKPNPSKVALGTGTDGTLALSHALDKVAFAQTAGPTPGVYVAPIP